MHFWRKMFWLIFSFGFLVGPLLVNSETACKRFPTLEVLQRFRWERSVLPWTTEDAEKQDWQKIPSTDEYSLDMYGFEDPKTKQQLNNFFILFYRGNLVGVAPTFYSNIDPEEVKPTEDESELDEPTLIKAERILNHLKDIGKRLMVKYSLPFGETSNTYSRILFVDPDILKTKAEIPCSAGTSIYFEDKEPNNWKQVPIVEGQIKEKNPEMNKQGCLDRFGNYYFYSLNNETPCRDVHGFFSFYDENGDMSGFGLFFMGEDVLWEDENQPHPYFRFENIQQVKDMVPNNNKCITTQAYQGFTTINILLKPDPETKKFKCKSKDANQLN